jgi:hypothetical protein
MVKLGSPSDYTTINPDYANGNGYYTTHTDVSNLLQIESFTAYTTPTVAEVGKLIKRAEERIDDATKHSYRPIIYKDEFSSFEMNRANLYPVTMWRDYIGFIQLEYPKVQKIVRLEIWQGQKWEDIASATATLTVPNTTTSTAWTITLTVGGYTFAVTENTHFYDTFGPKTTASQIVDAINEVYPMNTAKFTGETARKTVTANGNANVNISDFFYATKDGNEVTISSLLMGEDGSACTISSNHGSVTSFTDNEQQGRLEDFWQMGHEGKIFFHNEYPYTKNHSIRVTYVAGDGRVPAPIHEATTKFVAAEVIRHDDNSVLVAETGSNIDLKTKHDILLEEANKIIDGKKNLIHFIS